MKKGIKIIASLFIVALFILSPFGKIYTTFAEPAPLFGGHNDFGDGGWGGDWGDGDWDRGGDDDGGGFFFFGGTGSGGDGGSGGDMIFLIIIVIIVLFILPKIRTQKPDIKRKQGYNNAPAHIVAQKAPDRTKHIERLIKERDINFSADDLLNFGRSVFMEIQKAWCADDLTTVRPLLHKNLYSQSTAQVEMNIQNKIETHVENIAINTTYLTHYRRDKQYEYVTAYLNARMIEYHIDKNTGSIVRGDRTTRWNMNYKMQYMRSINVKTRLETFDLNNHNCPNCGATLEISSVGKCFYCSTVVTTGEYSWVLSSFGTIRPDSVDEGVVLDDDKLE